MARDARVSHLRGEFDDQGVVNDDDAVDRVERFADRDRV